MTSKRLGALLRSAPPATARTENEEGAASAEILPAAAQTQEAPPQRATRPTAEREVPLQVLIPERIRRQLGVKAAEEGRSLRELVLSAVRSLGIDVTDAEIRGKRGHRQS